ncbi:DUF4124 domain-containing protein [Pseudoxanthomonas sp. JBR18]|uniref:DUF4124 domain-containing protein n=1 Tax=Pseudoxanthomonas sp. JBR18 TaxID=2969308 RepID=UPI0023068A37|nr:DUF4124 domain-containing protein [Pseudoxanthomonas sp. JBR18]WCE04827.1 DUF4124 domain-containing protein [Pseudoxanthomonas sp. JBR18]
MKQHLLLPLSFALACALSSAPALADQVKVYRCQGADGAVALRDTPCKPGQRQEVIEMTRPTDPPASPPGATAPAPTSAAPAPPPPREVVVYRTPPRPMYECTTEEGETYTSDNGDGNPRLVPLWSLGYRDRHSRGGLVPIGNTWIHDSCHQLPQAEVCARLRDRRYEIQRAYHSALQSERHALDKEQRGLDARLDNDCGAD